MSGDLAPRQPDAAPTVYDAATLRPQPRLVRGFGMSALRLARESYVVCT